MSSHESHKNILIFHLLPGRDKAVDAAKQEACAVLHEIGARPLPGGPLSEVGGVFWIETDDIEKLDSAEQQFARLGYSGLVQLLQKIPESHFREEKPEMTRWRGRPYRLITVYQRDEQSTRARDPDQRKFFLEMPSGEVREMIGYRGDGGTLSRRALPVCDAQLLVNLSYPGRERTLLDPFAGAGGIVQEAVRSGLRVISVDIDPILRPGLEYFGATHHVADIRQIPLSDESVDAVATELPFDRITESLLAPAIEQIFRVLKVEGRVALMSADWQADFMRKAVRPFPTATLLDYPLDRKGSSCHLFVWQKNDW